jgi:hypothetical protein
MMHYVKGDHDEWEESCDEEWYQGMDMWSVLYVELVGHSETRDRPDPFFFDPA